MAQYLGISELKNLKRYDMLLLFLSLKILQIINNVFIL